MIPGAVPQAELAWLVNADEAIRTLAERGDEFTAETVYGVVGEPPNPNAAGGRFRALSMAGVIEPVRFVRSTRPERRCGVLQVWRGARS